MSLTLTNVQNTEFDALVKAEYHSRGFILRDTVRTRTNVIGATCQFRLVGQVIANQTAYQNTIAIQDPGFTAHTATLNKYSAATACDEVQDLTVNFDSRRELAMVVAMAIGRRSDQIVIDQLVVGAAAAGGTIIADIGTNYTYSKLRNVVQIFDDNAVPISERFTALSANNLRALLGQDQLISRFYTSNDAVVDGSLNYKDVMSVNVRVIPTMTEGGLPIAAFIRSAFAWHKMALGIAIGQDMRTEVNYLPRETSWFVNGLFFAGAVPVDPRGIIQINCDERANL